MDERRATRSAIPRRRGSRRIVAPAMGEELSKSQQKKLAKKAEKAAKKATAGGGGEATKKQTTAAPAKDAAPPAPEPPKFILNNPQLTPACLKAVWAANLAGVTLVPKKAPSTSLQLGSVKIGGGGNAMVQALSQVSFRDQLLVDEWYEWERTVLRPASSINQLEAAVAQLSSHLVGSTLSPADIVVAVTLQTVHESHLDHLQKHHPNVQLHTAGFAKAKETLQALIDQVSPPPIDLFQPSLLAIVETLFLRAALELCDTFQTDEPIVKRCDNPKFGDYQCAIAMKIFGMLKKQGSSQYQSPQQVAQALVEKVKDNSVVDELTLNGPGFVLCRLKASFLQDRINASAGLPKPNVAPKVCVVDFSSPNIAKEMHVGHLRSTIIGEAVCRILEAVGHTVHRVNHVGDWGTQFGMLIQFLREEYPTVATDGELPNITDLTQFYKSAKERFDESPEFKKQSQTNVVDLQSGDPECVKIWQMLCEVSRREFAKVYQRLDVSCEECGESFYNSRIPPVVEEFDKAGKLSVEEGGAKCVFLDGFKIPLMLQKSDGGFGYDSTDMAALKYRLQELNADRIIVITDFSQGDHFKMVYAAGRDIGWLDRNQQLEHIGFGTVMGEDGKRFKTRSGDTVRLVDLLDEAVTRMKDQLEERQGKATDLQKTAEAMGYGAVKYYDLRRNPTTNYKFSYDQMLDTKGDTAIYLLYARARFASILTKAEAEHGIKVDDLIARKVPIVIGHPSERHLVGQLQTFGDTLNKTLEDLYPFTICEYVYKVATAASDFVTQCKVLGTPEMESRVLLCHRVAEAMQEALGLLGIPVVDRL